MSHRGGSAWLTTVNSLTVAKRLKFLAQAPCVPNYVAVTNCIGDCKTATQTFTQIPYTCTGEPQTIVRDCSSQMPCTCSIYDFGLDPSVKTCGNCETIPEGQSCFFVCGSARETFTNPNAVRSVQCMKTGLSQIPPQFKPTCSVINPTCPNIVSSDQMITDHLSSCVGAAAGDACTVSCLPGFYNPYGWYDATCTNVGGSLQWNRSLTCQCQGCGESGDILCPNTLTATLVI